MSEYIVSIQTKNSLQQWKYYTNYYFIEHGWISQNKVEWEKNRNKGYILYDSIYIKFTQVKLTYERSENSGHCCAGWCRKRGRRTPPEMLPEFLHRGSSYRDVFTSWKCIELYAYDLCTFLYVIYMWKPWTTIFFLTLFSLHSQQMEQRMF